MTKDRLLQYCNNYEDFKKSFEKKKKAFLVDFLLKKNVDLTGAEMPERTKQLKALLQLKKAELVARVRKHPLFTPSIEKRPKEYLARFLLTDDGSVSATAEAAAAAAAAVAVPLEHMSVTELRAQAQKHPLYNAESFGKTRARLIKFLRDHPCDAAEQPLDAGATMEEEDDDENEGSYSPINIDEYLREPDEKELRDALVKILFSDRNVMIEKK